MQRISAQWSQWVEEILMAEPEDTSWDVTLGVLPEPAGDGQFVGFMAIELMIDGKPLTGKDGQTNPTVVSTRGLLPPFALREQVEQLVRDLLNDLRATRESDPPTLPNTAQWTPQGVGTESSA
jgi:hypothetical protein